MSLLVNLLKFNLARIQCTFHSRVLLNSTQYLSRNYSDKSSENDSSSSDEDEPAKKTDKKLNTKQKAALNKLNSLLTSIEVSHSKPQKMENKNINKLLQLAKPLRKQRVKESKLKKNEMSQEKISKQNEMSQEKISRQNEMSQEKISKHNETLSQENVLYEKEEGRDDKISPELVKAAKEAAESLGGDVEKTESEILQKLREHSEQTENGKMGKSMANLITGMKIDNSKPPDNIGQEAFSKLESIRKRATDVYEQTQSSITLRDRSTPRGKLAPGPRVKVRLFESGKLNIFTNKISEDKDIPQFPKLNTWDKLEENNLKFLVTHPPANHYDELIRWTKEDILWKFPIDNEQGLDEEAKISFHEHVFLDQHLEKGFPKKGPIRHFMELVITGLSKNPYITVKQKHDHINWFREYFESKKEILQELGIYN